MVASSDRVRAYGPSSSARLKLFLRNNASTVLIYGLIILVGGVTAVFAENFRQPVNLISILRQSIIIGLLAIGQSVVVLTGGIDMSIAMVARLVALVVATIFSVNSGNSTLILPLILLGTLIGAALGSVNGLLITRTHANPFIITFGVAGILRGVNLAIATTPIRGIPADYLKIYDAKIGIVPVNVIVMCLVWILAYLFTTRMRLGRALFAVGGSEKVARLSAIKVNRTLVSAYIFSGFCAALAGMFFLARTGVGDPGTD